MKWYLAVLKNYAGFEGRARRSEYWFFALFNMLIFISLIVLGFVLESAAFFPIVFLYAIATLIPGIAVSVRRMHDVGKSGWFVLVPVYNFILTLTSGENGENQYGPDPKNPELDITHHLVE